MIVRIGMSLHDSPDQELQLFAVPSICGPLTAQPIPLCVTEYDYLFLHNLFITHALHVGHLESDTDVLNQTMESGVARSG